MYFYKHILQNIKKVSYYAWLAFLSIILLMATTMADNDLYKKTAYDFSFRKSDGELLNLSSFKGKVLLIVNTASKCVFTKQYKALEDLHQKYKDKGLVIIAIPSNDFNNQEPWTDKEIQNFTTTLYGITFNVVSKESVLGKNAHPLYSWIKKELVFGNSPKWNFHKYLINREGKIANYFYSTTSPNSKRVTKAIEKLL